MNLMQKLKHALSLLGMQEVNGVAYQQLSPSVSLAFEIEGRDLIQNFLSEVDVVACREYVADKEVSVLRINGSMYNAISVDNITGEWLMNLLLCSGQESHPVVLTSLGNIRLV